MSWPPCSPDLCTPDFFLWGYLKSKVYDIWPATLDDPKTRIREEIEYILAGNEELYHTFMTVRPV
jgi:hypothetical protein